MIEISGVHEAYGQFGVVKGVDLRVGKGEVLSIIGDSGSGKSALLMCINGLGLIQRSNIRVDSIDVYVRGTDLNRLQREIDIVFQQWSIFPHLTVLENVILVPHKMFGKNRAEAEAMTLKQFIHVGFGGRLKVFPQRLSGGQQQRMAIARALAMSPDYMLFGEATSALDPQLIGEVLDTMYLFAEESMTMVLVTHEIRLARDVSDRVAFFHNDLVREIGIPDQMVGDPQRPETVELLRSVL